MDRKELKLLFNYLENNTKHLTHLQKTFLIKLTEKYSLTGVITKKEVECLNELKEYIPSATRETNSVLDPEADRYQAQYSSFDYGTCIGGAW
jgi:hypothetical protein